MAQPPMNFPLGIIKVNSGEQEEHLSTERGKAARRSLKVNNDSPRSAADAVTQRDGDAAVRTGKGANSRAAVKLYHVPLFGVT